MSSDDKKKTLTDADITTDHKSGRREFIGMMAVGGAVGAAGVTLTASEVRAQTNLTDSDNGQCTDAAGYGRGASGTRTGVTDADNGSTGTDLAGYGRGYCG